MKDIYRNSVDKSSPSNLISLPVYDVISYSTFYQHVGDYAALINLILVTFLAYCITCLVM